MMKNKNNFIFQTSSAVCVTVTVQRHVSMLTIQTVVLAINIYILIQVYKLTQATNVLNSVK